MTEVTPAFGRARVAEQETGCQKHREGRARRTGRSGRASGTRDRDSGGWATRSQQWV